MARSAVVPQEVAAQEFSADEQAQFEQMREDDAAPVELEETPQETELEADPVAAEEVAATPERRSTNVPLAALQEERERRKTAEAAVAEERRRLTTLEERTNLLLQNMGRAPQQTQPQIPEIEIPDARVDPVGHIIATQQKLQRELEAIQGGSQQQQQLINTAQVVSAIQQRAAAHERDFTAETPDYPAAIQHLKNIEHRRLQLAGYTDAAQRENMITGSYLDIAARALQANENPAQKLYEMAGLYGYQKPEAAEETNGAQAPTPQQRLATVANGQRQNRTLSGTRGGSPSPLTAQRLIEMPESEFAKMLNTPEGMALLGE